MRKEKGKIEREMKKLLQIESAWKKNIWSKG
jgi:hypothetical protein